jgi:Thermophilic glucose-6-phosphate isomerase and related metalloenzymes
VAHFLFQTLDPAGPGRWLAFYIEARAGDKVIIPPGLDHCTINPGPEPLLFSDVIAVGVNGIYDRFKAARGAAYLEVVQDDQTRFIPNPAYRTVPHLQKVPPGEYPHLRLTRDEPLYAVFLEERGACWPFLADPSQFWAYFPDLAWLRS